MNQQDEVYVVMGYSGEYSNLDVWVAGVWTEKEAAIRAAEEQKAADRTNFVIWRAWTIEFGMRMAKQFKTNLLSRWPKERAIMAAKLGMTPEPPVGGDDTEYTVACVKINTRGKWSYV